MDEPRERKMDQHAPGRAPTRALIVDFASARRTSAVARTPAQATPLPAPCTHVNGIDLAAMQALTDAALAIDESESVTWVAVTTWSPGPAGTSGFVSSDYGDDDDQRDEPSPLEQLLGVANSCVILGLRLRCALAGLELRGIVVTTRGHSGLRGVVHLPTAEPGFRSLETKVRVQSDGPRERLDKIVEEVVASSPVLASLRPPLATRR